MSDTPVFIHTVEDVLNMPWGKGHRNPEFEATEFQKNNPPNLRHRPYFVAKPYSPSKRLTELSVEFIIKTKINTLACLAFALILMNMMNSPDVN
jgi:hypothetical protein